MRQRPKRDVAQEITNLIIATIEAGTLPWRRPWKKTGMGGAPLRAAGVPYTGINRLYLWAVADHYGYGSRYWMTWRQAIELGGQVSPTSLLSLRGRLHDWGHAARGEVTVLRNTAHEGIPMPEALRPKRVG